MPLFGGAKPPVYHARLYGMEQGQTEVYFGIKKMRESVVNQDEKDPDYYGTQKFRNIKGFFKGLYFDTVLVNGDEEERCKIMLVDTDGVSELHYSSFWSPNLRRLFSCFERGARIGYLEFVVYCQEGTFVNDEGNEEKCINKGFSVWHNGERLRALEDPERQRLNEGKEKIKLPGKKKPLIVRKPLNDYLKDVALSLKPIERTAQTTEVVNHVASVDSILEAHTDSDASNTPITDRMKKKIAEDDNDDLPF